MYLLLFLNIKAICWGHKQPDRPLVALDSRYRTVSLAGIDRRLVAKISIKVPVHSGIDIIPRSYGNFSGGR